MSSIDWGDAPTWVGAFFAAGAAAGSIWTLASQRAQIKEQREFIALQSANLVLERAELEATLAERRSEQARHVHVEVTRERTEGPLDDRGGRTSSREYTFYVFVRNGSSAPVRDVTAYVGDIEASTAWRFGISVSKQLGALKLREGDEPVPVPVAGATTNLAFPFGPFTGDLSGPVKVLLTDNNGIRWRLD